MYLQQRHDVEYDARELLYNIQQRCLDLYRAYIHDQNLVSNIVGSTAVAVGN